MIESMPKFDLEELEVYKKDMSNSLSENNLVINLLKEKNLDPGTVLDNPFIYKRYVDSICTCKGCGGLNSCKQQSIGLVTDIYNYQGYPEEILRPCKFKSNEIKDNKHLKNFVVNMIPTNQKQLFLNQVTSDNSNKDYRDLLTTLKAKEFNKYEPGLYLVGDVGVGKTYLMSAIANTLAADGNKVAFIYLSAWIRELRNMISENLNYNKLISDVSKVDYLFIDDLGAESISDWGRDEILLPIFNARMDNKRSTWFSSNIRRDNLLTHYKHTKNGDDQLKSIRLVERIESICTEIVITGNNRREKY